MKLEINVEGQEPLFHKIKSQKTLIGSGTDCDVVLQADGISRKHAVIHADGDQFFVIDQGSTNGSFINEERLTPGSKASFTTFFPVKLGFHVTITLMDDDEAEAGSGFSFADTLKKPEPSIKKVSSSLPDRSKTSTGISSSVSAKRGASVAAGKKKKTTGKKSSKGKVSEDEKRMGTTKLIAFLLVAGSVGYFIWDKKQAEKELVELAPPKIEDQVKAVEKKLVEQNYISPSPKGVGAAANGANIMKCSFPLEKKACELMKLPHPEFLNTGMVMTANAYVFVLPSLRQVGKTFETFREERGWRWDYRPFFDQRLDNRDVAGLYFVRAGAALWQEIPEDDMRDWVYILFVNSQGSKVENMLFAKTQSVIDILTSPELESFKQASANTGIVALDNVNGLFRVAPLED